MKRWEKVVGIANKQTNETEGLKLQTSNRNSPCACVVQIFVFVTNVKLD